jgi:hypothetical protein
MQMRRVIHSPQIATTGSTRRGRPAIEQTMHHHRFRRLEQLYSQQFPGFYDHVEDVPVSFREFMYSLSKFPDA